MGNKKIGYKAHLEKLYSDLAKKAVRDPLNLSALERNNWLGMQATGELIKYLERLKNSAFSSLTNCSPEDLLFYQAQYKVIEHILNVIKFTPKEGGNDNE